MIQAGKWNCCEAEEVNLLHLGTACWAAVGLTRSSKSRVLISISCKILSTLIHNFSSEDISALVCWISLYRQTHTSTQTLLPLALCLSFSSNWTWKTSTYLEINPPDSQRCRASVPSRNSSSGWWRTSTNTESSAFTSGFRRSSRVLIMSWTHAQRRKMCMVMSSAVYVHFWVRSDTSMQVLDYLQLLNDVLVVPGVDGSGWSGRAGWGPVVWVGAWQGVESRGGQHGADLSLQVQRERDRSTLRCRKEKHKPVSTSCKHSLCMCVCPVRNKICF